MNKNSSVRGQMGMVALAFLAIYLVWGSTYLAIRYAVEGIPPLLAAGTRHVIAGSVLCVWAWLRGERPTARHWRNAAVLGVLFFLIGHGALHWSEKFVPSGLAAVLIAIEPVFIAALQPAGESNRRSARTWLGFGLGLGGVVLLMDSGAAGLGQRMLAGSLAVLAGAFSWAVGVVYSRRAPLPNTPLLSAAMPMLCGGALLYATAAVNGDFAAFSIALVPLRSLAALAYLTVFGSLIAFTAYMWLLDRYSAELVATHTYVNPVVAILLGWMVAGEPVHRNLVLACVLILASIAVIRSARRAGTAPSHRAARRDGEMRYGASPLPAAE